MKIMLLIYHRTCKRYSTRPGSLVGLLESFPEPQSKIMEGSSGMAVSLPWYSMHAISFVIPLLLQGK